MPKHEPESLEGKIDSLLEERENLDNHFLNAKPLEQKYFKERLRVCYSQLSLLCKERAKELRGKKE